MVEAQEPEKKKYIIGIDLGTTNSAVAIYLPKSMNDERCIIENQEGIRTTPSMVTIKKDQTELVGKPSKTVSTREFDRTFYDAKRMFGKQFNDPNVQDNMKLWPFELT